MAGNLKDCASTIKRNIPVTSVSTYKVVTPASVKVKLIFKFCGDYSKLLHLPGYIILLAIPGIVKRPKTGSLRKLANTAPPLACNILLEARNLCTII